MSGVSSLGESTLLPAVTATLKDLPTAPHNFAVNYDPGVSDSQQAGYQTVEIAYSTPLNINGSSITGYDYSVFA